MIKYDYKILVSGGNIALESSVKFHMNQGWKPIGGMSILGNKFYQALFKEEEVSDEELKKKNKNKKFLLGKV